MKIIIKCSAGFILPDGAEATDASIDYGCTACEYIYNNKIHRCSKFTFLTGKSPQSKEEFIEEGKCLDSWIPILQLEMANTNRGQTSTLESFRNEMVNGQSEFNHLIKTNIALENQ